MNISNFKKEKKKRGFTLIEVLIAIAVLMITIVAPISIISDNISHSIKSQQQLIAFFLAQDAMEYVKNIKTNNRLTLQNNIMNNLDRCSSTVNNYGCTINTLTGIIEQATTETICHKKLRFNPSTGIYSYTQEANDLLSIFSRCIKITPIRKDQNNNDVLEMNVKVTVK